MYVHFLCIFWKCARSGVADEFANNSCLQLYSGSKFDMFQELPFNMGESVEQKGIVAVLKPTSFRAFVEGYLADKLTLEVE